MEVLTLARRRGIQAAEEVAASGLPLDLVRELCDAQEACGLHPGWIVNEVRRLRDDGGEPSFPAEWLAKRRETDRIAAAAADANRRMSGGRR